MKTTELRYFLTELSKLNNAFTHYFFVWNQFSVDYINVIQDRPEDNTVSFFKNNSYAPKHRIKLKLLASEHMKTNSTLINGIFALTLSSFEDYLKRIFEFSKQLDNSIIDLDQKGPYEEDDTLFRKVLNRLSIAEILPAIYINTFDYLRLKRNRLIHQGSQNISKTIRELIQGKGKQLNDYWNKTLPKKLQGIDFTSRENIHEMNLNILIDILNLLRGIAMTIDTTIINSLGQETVLTSLIIPNFLIQSKKHNGNLDKLVKECVGYVKTNYGYNPNVDIVRLTISGIV